MASVKNLKKDINHTLGDLLDACFIWQLGNSDKTEKAEPVINEVISIFDELIAKVHQKDVENKKSHFKELNSLLQEKATEIASKINSL